MAFGAPFLKYRAALFLLGLGLALFSLSPPAMADGLWQRDCQKDLAEVIGNHAMHLEDMYGGFDSAMPRLIGTDNALCIDDVIRAAEQREWGRHQHYRQDFIDELKWTRDLLRGDMKDVYDLAIFYRERNRDVLDENLDVLLFHWAVERNYPPAVFDLAQSDLAERSVSLVIDKIRSAAEQGYAPAMMELARRLFHGDGIEKSEGESWYWLKRLQQDSVDTSAITPKPLDQLLVEMTESERGSLAYWAEYYDELDFTGITIPDSFLSLTPDIPDSLSAKEIAVFREKFKSLTAEMGKAYTMVEQEFVTRTMGIRSIGLLSGHGQVRPLGMDGDEFVQRKCNYLQALDQIFPDGRDGEGGRLQWKRIALSLLFTKDYKVIVRDTLRCDPSRPNRETRELAEALAWAKKLDEMDPASLRALANEYIEKSGTVDKENFKLVPEPTDQDEGFTRLMHYHLGQRIKVFADYKEHNNKFNKTQ